MILWFTKLLAHTTHQGNQPFIYLFIYLFIWLSVKNMQKWYIIIIIIIFWTW